MTRKFSILFLIFALSCLPEGANALAHVPAGDKIPSWSQLDSQQQEDLADFAHRWDRMPEARRVRILQRHARWRQLPETERHALREGVRNFRRMSPDLRNKMRASMETVRNLPAPEQRRLRRLWRSMTPSQRREWLQRGGPGIALPPRPVRPAPG